MDDPIPIQLAVEDKLSETIVRSILKQSGQIFSVGCSYCRSGFGYLKKTIKGFNNAAKGTPFIVLTDLDCAECAPALVDDWLKGPKHHNLLFRVAVRKVEAWVLADRTAFARFLGIKRESLPARPDELDDPKGTLIDLAGRSRRRSLREGIVPKCGSTAKIGPDYNGTLGRFIDSYWDVQRAKRNSPSLRRAYKAIRGFEPILAKR